MDEQREGEEKVIDISEEGESKDNTLYFHDAQKHADESRRVIAYSLVGLLIFTYVLSILGALKNEVQHRWSNGIGGDEWARGTVS